MDIERITDMSETVKNRDETNRELRERCEHGERKVRVVARGAKPGNTQHRTEERDDQRADLNEVQQHQH